VRCGTTACALRSSRAEAAGYDKLRPEEVVRVRDMRDRAFIATCGHGYKNVPLDESRADEDMGVGGLSGRQKELA